MDVTRTYWPESIHTLGGVHPYLGQHGGAASAPNGWASLEQKQMPNDTMTLALPAWYLLP